MKIIFGLAVLSILLCGQTLRAQDNPVIDQGDVEVADVVVCETQAQVEQYIMAYNGDQDAAIRTVNRVGSSEQGCGMVSAAFVRGAQLAAMSHGNMAFKVFPILVVGIESGNGFRAIAPAPYFAAFGVREYSV